MSSQQLKQSTLTVSELNDRVQECLTNELGRVLVSGEISNFTCPRSGHWYFSLKDTNAQVRCVMFKWHNSTMELLADGQLVTITATCSLYKERGDYQLIVTKVEQVGAGKLHIEYQKRLKILESKGLFSPEYKQSIPKMATQIALITSNTGAAIRDVLNTLKRRFPLAEIDIFPTQVQGQKAAGEIVNAIKKANNLNNYDVILLVRGGGSIEDLWPFNEVAVAEAIFDSKIPLVSGVGHETDFTIADFVADLRAATPTAAAELVSSDMRDILDSLRNQEASFNRAICGRLQQLALKLDSKMSKITHPKEKLKHHIKRVAEVNVLLTKSMQQVLTRKQQQFKLLMQKITTISPLATLARGYSIVTKDDNVITDSVAILPDDKVDVRLKQKILNCRVVKVNKILGE